MQENLSQKKAVLIIASKDYQDIEYAETKNALERAGINTVTASSRLGEAHGKLGGKVEVKLTLDQVEIKNFDAIVFIGGGGAAQEYFENVQAHSLAKKAAEQKKVIAAICCAPMILAKAGILGERKVTVWPDKNWINELAEKGAKYIDQDVVVDGKLITGAGPQAAKEFGEAIAKTLFE